MNKWMNKQTQEKALGEKDQNRVTQSSRRSCAQSLCLPFPKGRGTWAQQGGSGMLTPHQISCLLFLLSCYLRLRLSFLSSFPPSPFTVITLQSLEASRFTPSCHLFHKGMLIVWVFSRGAANCCQNSALATHIHIINHTGNQKEVAWGLGPGCVVALFPERNVV